MGVCKSVPLHGSKLRSLLLIYKTVLGDGIKNYFIVIVLLWNKFVDYAKLAAFEENLGG